jgi:hypothetical protein
MRKRGITVAPSLTRRVQPIYARLFRSILNTYDISGVEVQQLSSGDVLSLGEEVELPVQVRAFQTKSGGRYALQRVDATEDGEC